MILLYIMNFPDMCNLPRINQNELLAIKTAIESVIIDCENKWFWYFYYLF